ncbi:MAG: efflux RND transporter periplasmic adaptor subunit [Pseudomonadota bacterium]
MTFIQKTPVLSTSLALIVSAILVLFGHSLYKQASAEEVQAGQQPQAMPVQTLTVEAVPTQLWRDFSARMEAVEFAEIRPQVSGRINEIRFKDGETVEKGDILYVIDPRPFKAALDQAKAELSSARSEATLAQTELKRAQDLIKTNAVSQRVLDERDSHAKATRAAVNRAKAILDQAEINLDYAYVKAPISGRIGRAEIKVGNLVEANINAPVLTSIVATDKIFADFEVDEKTYLTFVKSKAQTEAKEQPIPVKLYLNGEDSLVYDGVVDSFDNRIDVSNGTIRARALFENSDGILIPGMFANIKVGSSSIENLITVPETAIGTDQDRKFVYVVDEENMARYREVKTGDSYKGSRVITSGLSAGDMIITEGLIRIRPDMPVSPQVQG